MDTVCGLGLYNLAEWENQGLGTERPFVPPIRGTTPLHPHNYRLVQNSRNSPILPPLLSWSVWKYVSDQVGPLLSLLPITLSTNSHILPRIGPVTTCPDSSLTSLTHSLSPAGHLQVTWTHSPFAFAQVHFPSASKTPLLTLGAHSNTSVPSRCWFKYHLVQDIMSAAGVGPPVTYTRSSLSSQSLHSHHWCCVCFLPERKFYAGRDHV